LKDLPEASQRLVQAIPGLVFDIHLFPEGTKTAEDAARAIGCPVSAIVKSLVFVVIHHGGTEEPVLALVPGDLRVDTEALATVAGAIESISAVRLPSNWKHPAVDVRAAALVEAHLFLAEVASSFQGREVEEAKVEGLLELENALIREKDEGDVGLAKLDVTDRVGIGLRPEQGSNMGRKA